MGSFFDLWFLVPLIGLMVGAERGGDGQDLGRDLLFLGGAYLLSALVFRTPLPVQPLKVWAFLFLILRPTPLAGSLAAMVLGLLLFCSGRFGLVSRLENALGDLAILGVRRAARIYVQAISLLSFGILGLHSLSGILLPDSGPLWRLMEVRPPGTVLGILILVLAQLPVTVVNGVLSTVRERRRSGLLSGEAKGRLTGSRSVQWLGLASVAAGALGVLPFCHGGGGLWAYRRYHVQSLAPSVFSSVVLIALGGWILSEDRPLPGPAIFSFFLAGFLLAEFLLKRKERGGNAPPQEEGSLAESPLGIWALLGGMMPGVMILGGVPAVLFFFLGMNTALASSRVVGGIGELVKKGSSPGTILTILPRQHPLDGRFDPGLDGRPGSSPSSPNPVSFDGGTSGSLRPSPPENPLVTGAFTPSGLPSCPARLNRRPRGIGLLFRLLLLFILPFYSFSFPSPLSSRVGFFPLPKKVDPLPQAAPRAP
ncbi:MAG: molybdate transporter family protein [Nitrospirota bacterium]|nr:molybdate transporter family protein [Nitrospirota bacterium]